MIRGPLEQAKPSSIEDTTASAPSVAERNANVKVTNPMFGEESGDESEGGCKEEEPTEASRESK